MNPANYLWDCERLISWGNAIAQYLRKYSNIYLLREIPGNVGDHLIWEGTTVFLDNQNISFKEIAMQDLHGVSSINGCLLIPGSGALSKNFNEWLPELIQLASTRFTNVVVLPSKINPEVESVKKILSLSNVAFFAREAHSFSKSKGFGVVGLGVDLALFSQYFNVIGSNKSSPNLETLVCLRTDEASKVTSGGYSLNNQVNNDISVTKSDLDGWMQAIKYSESIVTDRLHIAVSAVMLNKKLFYIDADVNKLSNYFEFTFGSTSPTSEVILVDLEWLSNKKYVHPNEVS